MNYLKDAEIERKSVFLRVDWNVPLKDGEIVDDKRIRATIPTIEYLQSKNCKIIIGTHLGRPDGEIVHALSTRKLAQKYSELEKTKVIATDYVIESPVKLQVEKMRPKDILVLGNLRWHAEEETNNPAFAHILASYADVYVDDAFAVCHRSHASVEEITKFLLGFGGFLLEKEITSLKILTESPRQPFVLVLGGAKIQDKIGVIKKLIPEVSKILIGGAIANTFRYFQGMPVSHSLYEPKTEYLIGEIVNLAGDKLVIPTDDKRKDLGGGNFAILDIGPETIENYKKIIAEAKTIFWNGNMGYSEEAEFELGTQEIAKAIEENPMTKIVAGGDTVGFLTSHQMENGYSFISTGGSATLEFLAGVELPGLKVLGYYDSK